MYQVHLHSSMVRLETSTLSIICIFSTIFTFQYGQIRNIHYFTLMYKNHKHLHSSMVRLETAPITAANARPTKFTFQYGQIRNFCRSFYFWYSSNIYIPVWLDQKHLQLLFPIYYFYHLHSSMVRLETPILSIICFFMYLFTFQYGQIRNVYSKIEIQKIKQIYIPVWLDQKRRYFHPQYYLH